MSVEIESHISCPWLRFPQRTLPSIAGSASTAVSQHLGCESERSRCDTSCRRVASFTPLPLNPRGKSPPGGWAICVYVCMHVCMYVYVCMCSSIAPKGLTDYIHIQFRSRKPRLRPWVSVALAARHPRVQKRSLTSGGRYRSLEDLDHGAFLIAAIFLGMDSYKLSKGTASSCCREAGGVTLFLNPVSKTDQSGSTISRRGDCAGHARQTTTEQFQLSEWGRCRQGKLHRCSEKASGSRAASDCPTCLA
jgi:hypothetical protein